MKKLLVIFPGIGYHADKPLLYYGRKLAEAGGYTEQITTAYTFSGGNIRGNESKMKEAAENLYAQAEEMLKEVFWADYDDILFMSKSIGTIIATQYASRHHLKGVRHILYTPLEYTFLDAPQDAIAFIGTNDPWSDVAKVIALCDEYHIPLHVYDGGNHSLEKEDVLENLQIMEDVMAYTKDYIPLPMA